MGSSFNLLEFVAEFFVVMGCDTVVDISYQIRFQLFRMGLAALMNFQGQSRFHTVSGLHGYHGSAQVTRRAPSRSL